ncbi:forkhead box protein N1 [Trichonephila inaurata madagascariensis]|uniref:Forkhead box protein N1 n=1 Tax=Trichonephila inaurata madagascariensis TaxID=2747483 RepID=A0A8X6XN94_9ARAC|nr:forkhead box protein N1 [Trichonephila inaurata madagascariensis]
MDVFGDSFKLHDMIDSDMRSLRSEFGDYLNEISFNASGSHLDFDIHMDALDATFDSELSNDGQTGWLNSSQLLNGSADFDSSIGGLLVNPRTALPVSLSESSSSSVSSLTDIISSEFQESSTFSSSINYTVGLPNQDFSSNTLDSEITDTDLAVNVPTPSSPSPHNAPPTQFYSAQEYDSQDEVSESPKPKPKNKSGRSSQVNNQNSYPKPAYSYSCLIAMALKNSKTGSLPVNEIYDFMTENFPYFKTAPNGWKNSVRHNLSLNKCFEKIEKPVGNNSTQRKGYLWAMNPAKIEKMEEELQKWGSKDPAAIRKSMANPERLALIEKGELRSPDSDSEYESTAVSQEDEEDFAVEEKENELKVQVANVGNDILNGEFSTLGDSMNIEPCLPDLETQLQKGVWENLSDDRMQFLSDSPISPLSPKNSETMDEDSSLDSAPSVQRSYSQANFIYKNTPRASTSSTSSNRLRNNSSRKDKGTCNV